METATCFISCQRRMSSASVETGRITMGVFLAGRRLRLGGSPNYLFLAGFGAYGSLVPALPVWGFTFPRVE